MKYNIGDIVEVRGGLGFADPGPWVVLKRQKILRGDFKNNGVDLAAVYFGRYLGSGKITRPGAFEANIELVNKPSKQESAKAHLLRLLFSEI